MKVSLITTVLNEENSIKAFLESVSKQSKLPDELIIVDGDSADNTLSVISNFIRQMGGSNFQIKFLKKRGNRSVGRNKAIKNSTGDIIAVSDSGCILDKNWFAKITQPFIDKNIDVVAGYYKPKTYSIFEKSLSTYTCVMSDRVDPQSFLPSSRSVAFRKSSWRKADGYPEEFDTCEDLVFARKLKKAGFRFRFAKNAIVYWPQRKNIFQAFKQFLGYAIGDGQAFYFRPQTPFLFARYIFGAMLLGLYFITKSNLLLSIIYLLLTVYLGWSIWKNYRYVKHPKAFLYLPILQLTSDAAVLLGMSYGLLKLFIFK